MASDLRYAGHAPAPAPAPPASAPASEPDLSAEEKRALELAIQESLAGISTSTGAGPVSAPVSMAGVSNAAAGGAATHTSAEPAQLPFNGRFVAHLTMAPGSPAGTVLPAARVVKAWRVANDGPAAWPQGVRLQWVAGELLGGPGSEGLSVPPAAPGSTVDIALSLQAPPTPGRYQSYWRLTTGEGRKFGARLWLDLYVEAAGEGGHEGRQGVPVEDEEEGGSAHPGGHGGPAQQGQAPRPHASTSGITGNSHAGDVLDALQQLQESAVEGTIIPGVAILTPGSVSPPPTPASPGAGPLVHDWLAKLAVKKAAVQAKVAGLSDRSAQLVAQLTHARAGTPVYAQLDRQLLRLGAAISLAEAQLGRVNSRIAWLQSHAAGIEDKRAQRVAARQAATVRRFAHSYAASSASASAGAVLAH